MRGRAGCGLALAGWLCLASGPAASASASWASALDAPSARDAIARVAYAEAAGQGDAGLAGVVFTILNRVESGNWGASVEGVVNARGQFEPVMRAGGDWRALRAVTPAERARIDTILNLALEGRLPDPTHGARYFQNPAIVADRARSGAVSPKLLHFGGATPSAVIGDHAFYVATGRGAQRAPSADDGRAEGQIFVDGRRAAAPQSRPSAEEASSPGERGLFVLADGQIVSAAPDRAVR